MTTTRELSFFLVGHPPNDNETRRWHWGRKAREARVWKDAATWASRDAYSRSNLPGVFTPVRVEVEFRYKVSRSRDRDNLVASLKPVIDGLKVARIIKDDSPEWMPYPPLVREVVDPSAEPGIWVRVVAIPR